MPPWKPVAGFGPKLKHDPSLTREAVAVLEAWAEAGAPRGEEKDSPIPAAFSDGWTLGTPDLVLEMPEEFQIPATGPDIYRCFVIPTNLRRDAYISAVEYRPGNRRVVHHIMAFLDSTGAGASVTRPSRGPDTPRTREPASRSRETWAAGRPATFPTACQPASAELSPLRSDALIQVHYHPTGKPETDRTRLGIYFCHQPVEQTLHWANATNDKFRLAPGQSNIEVKATWSVPVDLEALAVTPHMHQLGRDFQMTVLYPGGRNQDLLHIDAWDPNWQNTYYFEKRIPLPRGSTVKVVAHFDNSAHPRNPHQPPKLVIWGPEATDEMCVGYIGVVKKGQDLTQPGAKDDLFEILAQAAFPQGSPRAGRQQSSLRLPSCRSILFISCSWCPECSLAAGHRPESRRLTARARAIVPRRARRVRRPRPRSCARPGSATCRSSRSPAS